MKKILLILIDGIGDVGTPDTQFKTPLQLANIPAMDSIACHGICGMMDPVEPGLSCGSDTAHMSIFGYDPFKYYRGRGAFETMGSGIDMQVGDIAFKCNFAHIDNGIVKLRRVDRHFPSWGLPLIDSINGITLRNGLYTVTAKHATEHRIGLKISGPNLSDLITGTDPLKDNLPLQIAKPKSPIGELSAQLVNELSQLMSAKLSEHPINKERQSKGLPTANLVLMRGCGQRIDVPTFLELHGLKGAVIAPTAIIQGIGKTIGLEHHAVQGATGDYHSDFMSKGRKALELLNQYDFVFLHIKAVDDAGHDKSLELKIKYLELADDMVKMILHDCPYGDLKVAITGDHTTPVWYGDHTFQPVPLAVATLQDIKQHKHSSVKGFDEVSCLQGDLGRFCGREVIGILKQYE